MATKLKEQQEGIQRRTFLKWTNIHLRRGRMKIDSIDKGFQDGTALCTLCEVITGEKVGKRGWNHKPKNKIHELENLSTALKFLKSKGLKTVGIGNSSIHDGNITLILGLLWTIILRFQIQEISIAGVSGKKGLILWAKKNTKHRKPDVNVKNLHKSWADGLAFCALIEKFRPDLIDFDKLDKTDPKACLETAFKIAEDELDIPQLLEVEDMLGCKPDEKAVTTYVSELFKYFSKFAKLDGMVEGIKEAVAVTVRHDKYINDYTKSGNEVKDWIEATKAKFSSVPEGSHLEDIQKHLDDYQSYLRDEKPKMHGQLFALEGVLGAVHNSQEHNKRPAYMPPAELDVDLLEDEMDALTSLEESYQGKLREMYIKFRKYRFLLLMFTAKRKQITEWIEAKAEKLEELIEKNNESKTLPEGIISNKNILDFLEDAFFEQERYMPLLAELSALAKQIEDPFHAAPIVNRESEEIDATCTEVMDALKAAETEAKDKLARLEDALQKQAEYRKLTSVLAFNVSNADEKLREPVVEESVAAVQNQLDSIEALLDKCNSMFVVEMKEINDKSEALTALDVPFEGVQPETLQTRVDDFGKAGLARLAELQLQLQEEKDRDAARADFADKANAFKQKLVDLTLEKNKIAKSDGDAQSKKDGLDELRKEYDADGALLKEVLDLQKVQESLGIVVNPLTKESAHSLEAKYNELGKTMEKLYSELEAQLADTGGIKLSKAKVKELKNMFDSFDADGKGTLDKPEFHTACTAMGVVLTDDEMNCRFGKFDNNNDGFIDYDEFLSLMEDELMSSSSLEDVLGSFKTMADGKKKVDMSIVKKHFSSHPEISDFIEANMVKGNYTEFSKDLFSR